MQINAEKTQFILFHAPGKRIPIDTEIVIADSSLKPLKQVKLLGITLDVGLTFGQHINSMVGNCKGLLSVLSKAAPMLPSELLRMAYISLVRSRLEYCSAVWSSASATNLKRLDSLQKIAVRIIDHAHRSAHSQPLMEKWNIKPLHERRVVHIAKIVEMAIENKYHPTIDIIFEADDQGNIIEETRTRINIGRRRFEVTASLVYKEYLRKLSY